MFSQIWILLIVLSGNNAVHSVEFDNKAICERARADIRKVRPSKYHVIKCYPKTKQ